MVKKSEFSPHQENASESGAPSDRLLLGLRTDFLAGIQPLQTWILRSQRSFLNLRVSNVYRVNDTVKARGWLSELWVVVSVDSRVPHEELESFLFKLGEGLILETVVLLWGSRVHLDPEMPLPNPELHRSQVFMQCASEVEPDLFHPILGQTLTERLKESSHLPVEFFAQGRHLLPKIVG